MATIGSAATLRLANPEDCARIGEFLEELGGPYYRERFPGKTAADLYRWKFFSSPFGESAVALAESSGEIVSLASAMPKRMQFGGQLLNAYELGDFFTAESHRGRGLFTSLIDMVTRVAAERGGHIAYVRPNDTSFPILQRRGFQELQQIHQRSFPVPSQSAASRIKPSGPVLRTLGADALAKWFALPRGAERATLTAKEVDRFPPETDALWQKAGPQFGVSIARTAEYLNWRYANSPAPFRLWSVQRGTELTGTAVTFNSHRSRVGYILDAFAAPEDDATSAAILHHCFDYLVRAGCRAVYCWTVLHGPTSALQRMLRRACFRIQEPVLHVAFRELQPPPCAIPAGPWHLCMGDFDGF